MLKLSSAQAALATRLKSTEHGLTEGYYYTGSDLLNLLNPTGSERSAASPLISSVVPTPPVALLLP